MTVLNRSMFDKLMRRGYREAYVEEHVRMGIAYQIRALRDQRGLTQKQFADLLCKPQSVVSRLEDPGYGKLSLQTLLDVAASLDVALKVRFQCFGDFFEENRNVSEFALRVESFDARQFEIVNMRDNSSILTVDIPISKPGTNIDVSQFDNVEQLVI